MNLNLDLNAIPRREAALILRALAGVYDSEGAPATVEKPKKAAETIGNKLMRDTIDRNLKLEAETTPGIQETGATVDVPPRPTTQLFNSPDLSAGPPTNQPIDELDQEQGITETVLITPTVTVGPLDKPGGLPWDDRIHTKSKGKMGSGPRNGCWKYKPKITDALKVQVEAELRAQLPPAEEAPAAETQIIAPPLNTAGPSAGPAPGPQETIGEVVQHTFNAAGDFPALLLMVTDDVGAKKMPQGVTSSITNDLKCENIMALGQHPDKYQAFADTWGALKNMIALQPTLMDQCLTNWIDVRRMLKVAMAA